MQEKFLFSYYYKYSLLCALAYCIPVFFYLENDSFTNSWVLYIGNTAYILLLLVSGYFVNKKLNDYASLRSMIIAGVKVIFSSILLICVLTTILAFAIRGNSSAVVKSAPDTTDNLYYMLPLNAVLVNLLMGSFAVVVGAFTLKQNQKNARGQEIT